MSYLLSGFEALLHHAHQPIEDESHDANCDDAENNVLIDERIVFLPEETTDAGPTGQHFRGDNYQPGDSEAEPETGEHIGQCGWYEHLEERLGAGQFEHTRDIQIILRNRADADGGVEDGWPHRANGDGKKGAKLRRLLASTEEEHQSKGQP